MSKRVTAFETHAFNISWENLKNKIDEIDVNTITDKTILEEFSRSQTEFGSVYCSLFFNESMNSQMQFGN